MDAVKQTQTLERRDIPLTDLVKNDDNPNRMSEREFNLLYDNVMRMGMVDPLLVRPVEDGKYRIVGGHHRFDVATMIGFETVPCTVILDEKFDDEMEKFQLVRMNMIRGKLDPERFLKLYESLAEQYTDEVLQESFGFADEKEFSRIVKAMRKTLPDELKDKFDEAVKEVKTIEGLSQILSTLFNKYGDTLPYGYMIFDYGGKDSLWLRCTKGTREAVLELGDLCIDNKVSMDDLMQRALQQLALDKDRVVQLIANCPKVKLPKDIQPGQVPTLDFLEHGSL